MTGAAAPSLRSRLVVVVVATALMVLAVVVALVAVERSHRHQADALRTAAGTAEVERAVADVTGTGGALLVVALVLAAGVLAAGVALALVVRGAVVHPLAALAADARAAATEPSRPVRTDGPREVADVARDVEALRAELARRLDEADVAHAELAAAHEDLARRAAELARSNADLEQFAYVASHDLQEPLRKVASFTQLLARRYEGQLDERADEYIGYAVDGARRMQRLVDGLLGFARVGRQVGRPTEVDLAATLDQVVEDLRGPIEAAGARVEGEGLPVVRGDAALLGQLLANLVRNAVAYRSTDAPEVRIEAVRHGDRWELACRDNGVGIDAADAERVFVLFERVGARGSGSGTGIGLALCRRIVEHHGGEIWVDPTAPSGATIRWTLPA